MQELLLFKIWKISIRLYCSSHVGGQNNAHQLIFPYNIIENPPIYLDHKSSFIGPNNFNLVQRHMVLLYRLHQNLGQFNHNLYNHFFDDVIYKPPIRNVISRRSSKVLTLIQFHNFLFSMIKTTVITILRREGAGTFLQYFIV